MTPTLLLPGTLCDVRVFRDLVAGFAAPIILDHRDYGDVRAAAASLSASVPTTCVGVAFSLGSWVLLELARQHPERFAGLVLLAGNGYPHPADAAAARRSTVASARGAGLRAMIEADWPRLVGTDASKDADLRALVGDMAEDCGHDVHARQVEMNIARPDRRAFLANAPVPILVIAGAQDQLCPSERYEQAASAPRSRLVSLTGVGHYVPLEAPQAVLGETKLMFGDLRI